MLNKDRKQSNRKVETGWKGGFVFMIILFLIFYGYVHFHPRFIGSFDQSHVFKDAITKANDIYAGGNFGIAEGHKSNVIDFTKTKEAVSKSVLETPIKAPPTPHKPSTTSPFSFSEMPVLGPIPGKGSATPLFGIQHQGKDAIFALACKYPKLYYERFVGTLRDAGYTDDIGKTLENSLERLLTTVPLFSMLFIAVLAVSPEPQMKPGVSQYIKDTNIVAYAFDVDCEGKDNCRLQEAFLVSLGCIRCIRV